MLMTKIRKIFLIFFLVFLSMIAGGYFLVKSSYFQNSLAVHISKKIQESKGVFFSIRNVSVERMHANFDDFLAKDHHNDTLIYIKKIEVSMDLFSLLIGDFNIQKLVLTSPDVRIKEYENESDDNLTIYLNKLEEKSKDQELKPFSISSKVFISDGHFSYLNENQESNSQMGFKANQIHFSSPLFEYDDGEIRSNISQLSLYESNENIQLNRFIGNLKINKSGIFFNEFGLETSKSIIKADYFNLKMKNESWKDFNSFIDSIELETNIIPSELDLKELSAFIPSIDYRGHIDIESKFSGTLRNLTVDHIELHSTQKTHIDGKFELKVSKDQFSISGEFDRLESHFDEYKKWIPPNSISQVPEYLIRLGQINYKGYIYLTDKEVLFDGFLKSLLGDVLLNVSVYNYESVPNAVYNGFFLSKQFDIGKFLDNPILGRTSFDIGLDGKGLRKQHFDSHIIGAINHLDLYGYRYKNIEAEGSLRDRIFDGHLMIDDKNLSFNMKGKVDISEDQFKLDYTADIKTFNLTNLNLYSLDSIAELKGEVKMNLTGMSIDDIKGQASFHNVTFSTSKNNYFFKDFQIESMFDAEKHRVISINSPDLMQGELKGDFRLSEMITLFKNSTKKLFPIKVEPLSNKNQYYSFNFKIFNTAIEAFLPGVKIEAGTNLRGIVNGRDDHLQLYFNSPRFHYKDNAFINIDIDLDTQLDDKTHVQFDRAKIQGIKIYDFFTKIHFLPDRLNLNPKFQIKNKKTYEFDLDLSQTIDKDERLIIGINQSTIKYDNKYWTIEQNQNLNSGIILNFDQKQYSLTPIELSLDQSKLTISGEYKGDDYRRLNANLKEFDLSNIHNIEGFRLQGVANGHLNLEMIDEKLNPDLNISIDDLAINESSLGLFNGKISREEDQKFYSILGEIKKEGKTTLLTEGKLIDTKKQRGIDLDILFDDFEPSILNSFLADIIEINGKISGSVSAEGAMSNPNLTGGIAFNNLQIFVPYTNVTYQFKKPLISKISKNNFEIPKISFFDKQYKTQGTVSGKITHKSFDQWNIDLEVNTDNILALNTDENNDNSDYYGRVFAGGNIHFIGPVENLNINIDAKTKKNTIFHIPIGGFSEISDSDFIKFVPPKSTKKYPDFFEEPELKTLSRQKNTKVDISLEATEESQVDILIDPKSGHSLRVKGNGLLDIKADSYGKFDLLGKYTISKGNYFFNFANLVSKKFSIVKGGSITWTGDPNEAVLDVEALYDTKVSNIGEYLKNQSYSGIIDVQLKINITGNLYQPNIELGVDLPKSTESVRSAISYTMANQDQENRQFLSIITANKFSSENNDIGRSGLLNTGFEVLSNKISDIISNISDRVTVGVQYIQGNQFNKTSNEIDLSLTTRLSDRLTIQGNLGFPVSQAEQKTSQFVGEFDILYRLNKRGTIQLKAFNQRDEIEDLPTEVSGYRQGIGILYSKDFNSFKEIIQSTFSKKK